MKHAETFLRGFAIVAVTAANVAQIAGRHYGGAFLCGCLISWLWWLNAQGAARGELAGLREAYALGAGCGTVAGIYLVSRLYG